uniref:Sod_Cu domain-containing protein n=1 Tax=Globodera pallida TaxID=36090 RepID=A0A183CHM7_GLOPA
MGERWAKCPMGETSVFSLPGEMSKGRNGEFLLVGLVGYAQVGACGVAKFEFTHNDIWLSNIVGRALVVHKLEDNFGHGLHGEEENEQTVNVGPCVARGVIMIVGIGVE